jgi:pyruvate formate lyase activating enzyme
MPGFYLPISLTLKKLLLIDKAMPREFAPFLTLEIADDKIFLIKVGLRECTLYQRIGRERVRCGVCERKCEMGFGDRGFCKTRINKEGKLYTLYYGEISSLQLRPIEIKPFFHFYPNSTSLTYSTWGCNLRCPWCQNNSLSMQTPEYPKSYVSPNSLVEEAIRRGAEGICVSFNEPTLLFEHCLHTFQIAKRKGLYNCFVSNGYMTSEALKALHHAGLDAIRIDVKGGREVYERYLSGADHNIPWRNARIAKALKMHVEIINLIITGVNDSDPQIEELIDRHIENVGAETPIHFTRYYPSYKFKAPQTSIKVLERAYRIAKAKGISYPYLGNVPGHPYENTFCPECGVLLVERFGYQVIQFKLRDKRCYKCGREILMYGNYVGRSNE